MWRCSRVWWIRLWLGCWWPVLIWFSPSRLGWTWSSFADGGGQDALEGAAVSWSSSPGLLGLEDEEPPSVLPLEGWSWCDESRTGPQGGQLPGASSCCLSPSDEMPLIPSLPLTCKGQKKCFGFTVGNLSRSFVHNNNFIVDNGAPLGRIDCKILLRKVRRTQEDAAAPEFFWPWNKQHTAVAISCVALRFLSLREIHEKKKCFLASSCGTTCIYL